MESPEKLHGEAAEHGLVGVTRFTPPEIHHPLPIGVKTGPTPFIVHCHSQGPSASGWPCRSPRRRNLAISAESRESRDATDSAKEVELAFSRF